MDRYEFQQLLRQELQRLLRIEDATDGHVLTRRDTDEARMAFEAPSGGGLDPIDPYAILANNTTSSAAPTGVLISALDELKVADVKDEDMFLIQRGDDGVLLRMTFAELTAYLASVLTP